MLVRLMMPIFFLVVGVMYLMGAINLPKARLGDPNGPLYFPVMIGIFFIFISIIYLIKELKNSYQNYDEVHLLFVKRAPLLIVSTLILSTIYTLIFEKLGFLISTILFLGALLFIVNGRKKWIVNISVSVLFSVGTWFAFSVLLKVSLP